MITLHCCGAASLRLYVLLCTFMDLDGKVKPFRPGIGRIGLTRSAPHSYNRWHTIADLDHTLNATEQGETVWTV
ncbi:MAG: hypothetical protein ETSY2_21685 [Candidatus Entotheonella gemina]|uniref:Uncharacterized protein n=1 Tax=Candidatus Entotheonella gemina TaxID=1429439 RepID=W4M640_9BACT|nr:MAG: hypothetical protein ETSY2_21685 [Candidatus Entotheonella gemina]